MDVEKIVRKRVEAEVRAEVQAMKEAQEQEAKAIEERKVQLFDNLVSIGFLERDQMDASYSLTGKGKAVLEIMLTWPLSGHSIPCSVRDAAAQFVERYTSPGERAYNAYKESVGGVSYDGNPLKQFAEMSRTIRDGWEAAAKA